MSSYKVPFNNAIKKTLAKFTENNLLPGSKRLK